MAFLRQPTRAMCSYPILWLGYLITLSKAASVLFWGGTVIGFDAVTEKLDIIRNGSVLVENDEITAVFSGTYTGTMSPNTEVVDIRGDIISTGFVDTHRHGWQTAFKTLGSNTSLAEYISRYSPGGLASTTFTAEDIYVGQLAGLYEALNAGVTTNLDHAHGIWSDETAIAGLQASIDSGARVFWCRGLQDYSGIKYPFDAHVANFRNIATNSTLKSAQVSLGIAYDSFTSGNPNQTNTVIGLAKEFNVSVVTTHASLGPYGVYNEPETVHALGFLNTSIPIVFSHGSFLSNAGAQLLRQTNQHISITPESEMHFGHDHPRSHLIQDQASLGVDTYFTYSTDILTQTRMWLQSVRRTLYRKVLEDWEIPRNNPMSVNQAFLLATRNGGLALRRPDIGVLAKGAKADLVVWDGMSPGMLGWDDPVAAVILHAGVGDIKHVMVGGHFRKRNGKLTDKDYASIQQRFLRSARRIQQIWKETAIPVLEGQSFSGFKYAQALTVDTSRGQGNDY